MSSLSKLKILNHNNILYGKTQLLHGGQGLKVFLLDLIFFYLMSYCKTYQGEMAQNFFSLRDSDFVSINRSK